VPFLGSETDCHHDLPLSAYRRRCKTDELDVILDISKSRGENDR